MERLDFVLPDFTRISWVSEEARSQWEHRFTRLIQVWQTAEWQSVKTGMRGCCTLVLSPTQFIEQASLWIEQGLVSLPLEMQAVAQYANAQALLQVAGDTPFLLRVAVGYPAAIQALQRAINQQDEAEISRLVGYPYCCYQAFHHYCAEQGFIDMTWHSALASHHQPDSESQLIKLSSCIETNLFWQSLGLRLIPHNPCRYDCPASIEMGKQFILLLQQLGFTEELSWLQEIFDFPVAWSALHGIAEIKTPLLKISTTTDATPTKYIVHYQGQTYPLAGGQGLTFPYRLARQPVLSQSPSFKRGLAHRLERR
ncbi:hypothetical protein [Beggiatoa leptomitoformis]|uniref:Uncharacterized protein n=1 Tax=Beggiatoa leptomitoformis TaxID=288004 RepID=A0A2N9YIB3_9GAMM|nr:hypothetical protein [Beggiatoa leptomitoformis]ALG67649.1 hypothetical protein AL038_07950 [Beggiatoa leptomitoformis]AUI70115.1 hypothetical protein BLE401_16360 [Beggiatoa leptomitoformis]